NHVTYSNRGHYQIVKDQVSKLTLATSVTTSEKVYPTALSLPVNGPQTFSVKYFRDATQTLARVHLRNPAQRLKLSTCEEKAYTGGAFS
ncbi:MAG: hypothetical protein WDZ51_20280, partial [Pirellulaceae bacterium]